MRVGICHDGPWEGRFLTAESDFVPVSPPWGGEPFGEYCHDGIGYWHWVKWEGFE